MAGLDQPRIIKTKAQVNIEVGRKLIHIPILAFSEFPQGGEFRWIHCEVPFFYPNGRHRPELRWASRRLSNAG